MLVLVGWCMSLVEVGSLGKVRKSPVSGCTWTRCGPVTVLQIRLFCLCFAASVLRWVPCPEPLSAACSSSWCWGAQGRTELFSYKGWGGCQDLRKICGNRRTWNTRLCLIQLICIKMATKAFVCHTLQQDLRGAPNRMELLHRNVAFSHLCCLWLALFSTVLYVSLLEVPFPCSYQLPERH